MTFALSSDWLSNLYDSKLFGQAIWNWHKSNNTISFLRWCDTFEIYSINYYKRDNNMLSYFYGYEW